MPSLEIFVTCPATLRSSLLVCLALSFNGAWAEGGAKPSPEIAPTTAAQLITAIKAPGAKATLVNVWASFCVPCRHEFPSMLKVWREYKDKGLRLILVSTDLRSDIPAAKKYLAQQGIDFTTFVKDQPDMQFINALHEPWTGSIPATLVYDARGNLVTFWEGEGSEQEFRDAVRQVLDAKETK